MVDDLTCSPHDPSMALIRQLVTEYIVFPLGSDLIRRRIPEWVRTFLFYGPSGSGKTAVVNACVTETKALLFDLSPFNIEGIYEGKTQTEKLIATVMIVAKEYQPGMIYMDEAEKIWPAKGKKRRGRKKKQNYKEPTRIK